MNVKYPSSPRKRSYTIPCASSFRTAVRDLATRRRVNVADLARSVVLMVAPEILAAFADPGGPTADDRETVILKSGRARGRPMRRKPRLQIRISPGYDTATLRRALGMALAIDSGDIGMRYSGRGLEAGQRPDPEMERIAGQVKASREEIERLRAFDPLPQTPHVELLAFLTRA